MSDRLTELQNPDALWAALAERPVDPAVLTKNHIVSATGHHPAQAAFDMLRSRLLEAISDQGWSRIAVTAPTRGCGSSFVAANLAFALAQMSTMRSILLDMDLRMPQLDKALGVQAHDSMTDYLGGVIAPENFLVKAAPNLALALNDTPMARSGGALHPEMTAAVLEELEDQFCPDVMLFDMPPVQEFDAMLNVLPDIDAVLLVAGADHSTAVEVAEAERMISAAKPLLGVILNKADG